MYRSCFGDERRINMHMAQIFLIFAAAALADAAANAAENSNTGKDCNDHNPPTHGWSWTKERIQIQLTVAQLTLDD